MSRTPYNPDLHYFLVDEIGYAFTPFDDGDPETGGDGPWDEYESADHRIVINQEGRVEIAEDRNLVWEAWIDELRERS